MNEKQFSKTLIKKSNNKKLDKLSDKFLDDNNNEFENQMKYKLNLDKGHKYSQHLQDLLNNNKEKNEIKEKYTQKSADLNEPNLYLKLIKFLKIFKNLRMLIKIFY